MHAQLGRKRNLVIGDHLFELTLRRERTSLWHWLLAAPGRLLLSGVAGSEAEADAAARRAGSILSGGG